MKPDFNSNRVNQTALLEEVKEVHPHYLHMLSLAFWGLERGVAAEWPDRDRPGVEQEVGLLLMRV
jgi:hypothetical protein